MLSAFQVFVTVEKPVYMLGGLVILIASVGNTVGGGAGVPCWLCAWTSLGVMLCHHAVGTCEDSLPQATCAATGAPGSVHAFNTPTQTLIWAGLLAYTLYLVFLAGEQLYVLLGETLDVLEDTDRERHRQPLPIQVPEPDAEQVPREVYQPEAPPSCAAQETKPTDDNAIEGGAEGNDMYPNQKVPSFSRGLGNVGTATAKVGERLSWTDAAMAEEVALTRLERPNPKGSSSYSQLQRPNRLLEHITPRRAHSGLNTAMRSQQPGSRLQQIVTSRPAKFGKPAVEIVHVSNDRVQHMVLKKFLQAHSFNVKHANGSERLLDLLQCRNALYGVESFPDIVLLESEMHGMGCVDALHRIRMLYPQAPMPVIVVGDADMPEHEVCKALQAGAVDFMANPLTRQALLARIGVQLNLQNFWQRKVEAAQNEHLLQKILPSSVIQRLKVGQSCISDELDEVSVLFSDIRGFTSLAASIDTVELIDLLDTLFSSFDSLTDQHGVYKVETIGDAYMVVSGHDDESKEEQMLRLMGMAADMLKEVQAQVVPNGGSLQIRIGIHTGPAYAGVVGRKCPRYCLFGETVTVANKMESNGYPQTIHVSEASRARYVAMGGTLEFESLGVSNPTGKQRMETWVVKAGDWQGAVNSRAENLMAMSEHSSSSQYSVSDALECNSPLSPLLMGDYFDD